MKLPGVLRAAVLLLLLFGVVLILSWACQFRPGGLPPQLSLGPAKTYMSENALAPHSIGVHLRDSDFGRARVWTSFLADALTKDDRITLPLLATEIDGRFGGPRLPPLACHANGTVLTFRIPAPRSDGTEALILGASLYRRTASREDISSAGLVLAFTEFLWSSSPAARSRDIVVVLYEADSAHQSMQSWFNLYLEGRIPEASFIRAGFFLDWAPLANPSTLVIHFGTSLTSVSFLSSPFLARSSNIDRLSCFLLNRRS